MTAPSVSFLFEQMKKSDSKKNSRLPEPDPDVSHTEASQRCPCGNTSEQGVAIFAPHEQVLCDNCGFIFEDNMLSQEAEWNNYRNDSGGPSVNKSRCNTSRDKNNPYDDGYNMQFPKGQMTTFTTPDGKKIQYDMSKRNVWNIPHKQKAFWEVSNILTRGAERLGSPKRILDHAKSIWYQVTLTEKVIRGGVRQGIIANCLAYACRLADCPREDSEIATAFQIEPKNITKGHKVLKEMFVGTEHEYILYKASKDSSKFAKFISRLDLPFKVGKRCEGIFEQYDDEMSSIASKSRVAGIISYVVTDLGLTKPTQKEICECIKVCPPTLKKVVNILKVLSKS